MRKNGKLFAALLCAMVLCALYLPALAEEVNYIYYTWDEDSKVLTRHDGKRTDATVLTGGETELRTGWYVAEGEFSLSSRPTVQGHVHLILKDGCTLEANEGITVEGDNSLSIYAQSEGDDMGALTVPERGRDAGIGGTEGNNSGKITIHGGTVTAEAMYGAGIGGGDEGTGTVTIHGGTVTATAMEYSYGAGIGGGRNCDGTVEIHGGTVTATANYMGAGIGGGGYSSGTVEIYGGTVTAKVTGELSDGAAIGGGTNGNCTVTIYGGEVKASTDGHGAAIGGGLYGSGEVTIHGGEVKASTDGHGAAIGGGWYSNGTVTINGGSVTATASGDGAGIGNGYEGNDSEIFLNWTDAGDFIESDSYSGTVTLEKVFQYDDNGALKYAVGEISDNGALGGKKLEPPVSIPEYTVTVIANPTDGGTVTGGGTYKMGTEVTVAATPNQGYRFVNWTEGETVVSTDAEYTFMVLEDRTLTANFIPVYKVAVAAAPEAAGTVTGSGTYDENAEVIVTATPNPGYRFLNWTENGTVLSANANVSFSATADRNLTANFIPVYMVTVAASPEAGGTVTGGGTFDATSSITLTATASEGYHFVNWTEGGEVLGTEPELRITVTADRNLTANFELYTITVAADPPEGGTVSGGGLYASGASATIAAKPNPGYRFLNWTDGAGEVSRDAEYSFTVAADRTLTANFEELPPFDKEHVNFFIPAGSIGANAFAGDEAIAIVDASQCTSLGEHAFRDCKGLTQILLPADCVFPSSAVEGCEALVALYAPGAGTTQEWAEAAGIPFMPVE